MSTTKKTTIMTSVESPRSTPNSTSAAAPMAIPEPVPSGNTGRTRSGSISALLSSFSPTRSSSSTTSPSLVYPSSSAAAPSARPPSPSTASSYSEATEATTPRDVSPLGYSQNKPYALREGVFGHKDMTLKEEESAEDPTDFGFLGSRSQALHAHTRRASWSSRGPSSAPSAGAGGFDYSFGSSPPPPASIMGWVQNLSNPAATSPRAKAAAAPLPPLDTKAPEQDLSASTPPAKSNLGMLFGKMSVGAGSPPPAGQTGATVKVCTQKQALQH